MVKVTSLHAARRLLLCCLAVAVITVPGRPLGVNAAADGAGNAGTYPPPPGDYDSAKAKEEAKRLFDHALGEVPEDALTPDEIVACHERLVQGLGQFYHADPAQRLDEVQAVNTTVVTDYYNIFAIVFRPEYCSRVVPALEDLNSRGIDASSQPQRVSRLATDLENRINRKRARRERRRQQQQGEDEDPLSRYRRQLQLGGFQGDTDPTGKEFTAEKLGQGYTDFTAAAALTCDRYSYKACRPGPVGDFLITWLTAKVAVDVSEIAVLFISDTMDANCAFPLNPICPVLVLAKKVVEGIDLGVQIAFAAFDGVREAIEFTWDSLDDTRQGEVWENAKIILQNQLLELQKAEAILNNLIKTSEGLTAADKATITLEDQSLDLIDVILVDIQKTRDAVAIQLNKLGQTLQSVVKSLTTAVTGTLGNSEIRITNTIINAILDKFSIGGASRPGRLFVPPVIDGNLMPITPITARRRLEGEEGEEEESREEAEEEVEEGGLLSHREMRADRELQVTTSQLVWLWGYGCDGNDNDNNQEVDELAEDKIAPILKVSAVYAASLNTWFTNATRLQSLVSRTVSGVDDCGPVTFAADAVQLSGTCKDGSVSITASDRADNRVNEVVPVWYDPLPPTVAFDLRPAQSDLQIGSTTAIKATLKYVDLGLTGLAVNDACDPTPFVQVTVYSDEKDIVTDKPVQAVLFRRFDNQGRIIGWTVKVVAATALICKDDLTVCDKADGRVYTVRICAKDEAGNQACQQQSIGVSKSKKVAPVSQGNLFRVAHDAAFLNRLPIDNTESFSPNTFTVHS